MDVQAIKWLATHLKTQGDTLESVALQDSRFNTVLELAVRFGKTLIVCDVDYIEPMMYSLLRKDLEKQGPRQVVCIGDKYIDFHEGFRMYLVTRNPHPRLPPDAKPLVSVTNFTITRNGLEGRVCTGKHIQSAQTMFMYFTHPQVDYQLNYCRVPCKHLACFIYITSTFMGV